MEITFIGAAHEVTGSCHYLNACGKHILVDYGMEQGVNLYENMPLPVAEADIDFVFLTHAHIDHSGLLPLLASKGFRGKIYATDATAELCDIMLRDSAHIQMFEAEWRNRKAKRSSSDIAFVPLYTMEDADRAVRLLEPVPYGEIRDVCDGIKIRFTDVGHLLGSAAIEVWLEENSVSKKIVFSGDVGNSKQPILKDPQKIEGADYCVIESTYGDRLHNTERVDYVGELAEIIQHTFDKGGNVVIPSFAVGRTQEMLYFIREIKEKKLISGYNDFPVFVDSPLAVEATQIFQKNTVNCFDEEAMEIIRRGVNPISFKGLRLAITSEESKEINFDETPKVIISASGMCDAGRIRHHLKHNLWREDSTILFVGYQSVGTLGRALVEGAKEVKLFGEEIGVRAEIRTLTGLSGHADMNGLLDWLGAFGQRPSQVFVVHGDDKVTDSFASTIEEKFGIHAYAPYSGTRYDLAKGMLVYEAKGIPVKIKTRKTSKRNSVFDRLVAAGQRLISVIRGYEHCANKDIAKFADQINSLCDKWE